MGDKIRSAIASPRATGACAAVMFTLVKAADAYGRFKGLPGFGSKSDWADAANRSDRTAPC